MICESCGINEMEENQIKIGILDIFKLIVQLNIVINGGS